MLAINGGTPVRDTFLAYGSQWLDEKDIEAVVETLKSPFITQGPMIEKFEKKVAGYVGAKYAVAFMNGTAALHAAYYAAGIGLGDEMITTPITFVATPNAALYLGARPIFSDIDERTYNLDPEKAKSKITPKTKAIVSVDFTGQPANYDAFRQVAKEHGLIYISDGAHSLGATYKGKPVGTQADMTMFSFHPVKPITTGEGGVIVTDNEIYAEKLRLFRSHGITRENMEKDDGPWYYEMIDLGMNYRMTDIQAALGVSQIDKLDQFISRRRAIAQKYNEAFQQLEGVSIPNQLEQTESGWHLYILKLELSRFSVGRKEIFEALRAENIGVHVHYIPVHTQPYYRKLGYEANTCPIAEKWYEQILTLPIFPKMSDDDVSDVITAIYKIVDYYKK